MDIVEQRFCGEDWTPQGWARDARKPGLQDCQSTLGSCGHSCARRGGVGPARNITPRAPLTSQDWSRTGTETRRESKKRARFRIRMAMPLDDFQSYAVEGSFTFLCLSIERC